MRDQVCHRWRERPYLRRRWRGKKTSRDFANRRLNLPCSQVRVYKSIDDDDAVAHLIGDETLALATHEDKFYVAASGTNTVSVSVMVLH